MQQEFLFVSIS